MSEERICKNCEHFDGVTCKYFGYHVVTYGGYTFVQKAIAEVCKHYSPTLEPSAFMKWWTNGGCQEGVGHRAAARAGWNARGEADDNQLNQLSWDREIIEECQDRIRKLEEK